MLANLTKEILSMFLESEIDPPIQKGSIEVICGSMFSGKTEELIRRLKRAKFAKLKIVVFKPKVDNRYHNKKVVSHNSNAIASISIKDEQGNDYVKGHLLWYKLPEWYTKVYCCLYSFSPSFFCSNNTAWSIFFTRRDISFVMASFRSAV